MGKRIIVKDADFSTNGIAGEIPLTEVYSGTKTIAFAGNKINITNLTSVGVPAGVTKAKFISNYVGNVNLLQEVSGSYVVLGTIATNATATIKATTAATTIIIQSVADLTAEEKTALTGSTVTLKLYTL